MNLKEPKRIYLAIANHKLLIKADDLLKILKKREIKIYIDSRKQQYITMNDFSTLLYDEEIRKLSKSNLIDHITGLVRNLEQGNNDKYNRINSKKITEISWAIQKIQTVHFKYHNTINLLEDETATVAAYLLFGKAINLMNMTIICLRARYFNSSILFRIIEETVDLAEYFIVTESTVKGKENLKLWFYENHAVKHQQCRDAISKDLHEILKEGEKNDYYNLINSLYQLKSKTIHPTRNFILEQLKYSVDNNSSIPDTFDYGPCSFEEKMEHVIDSFAQTIESVICSFQKCFMNSLPLDNNEIAILDMLRKKFA